MPVLHRDVPHVRQLRFAPGGFAIQPAIWIGHAAMSVVLAPLAVEVRAVAVTALIRAKALLRTLRWHSIGRADGTLASSAQASISVPSTEKCSSESSGTTFGWCSSRVVNFWKISPLCSRSRFLVNVVGSHTGSSATVRRTSDTAGCSPVAPSTDVPRAGRSWDSAPSEHREQIAGSAAADGFARLASPARHRRTGRPGPGTCPASRPPEFAATDGIIARRGASTSFHA